MPDGEDENPITPFNIKKTYFEYNNFKSSPLCNVLSGVGLTSWFFYNSYKAKKGASQPLTKYELFTSTLKYAKNFTYPQKETALQLLKSALTNDTSRGKLLINKHFPVELSATNIMKAYVNPSPLPYQGYRLPKFSVIARAIFASTAPTSAIENLINIAGIVPRTQSSFLAEMIVHARRRLFINSIKGISLGIIPGYLLPVSPYVGMVNTANTILGGYAMLQEVSEQIDRALSKTGSKNLTLAGNIIKETNKRTMQRYLWRMLPASYITMWMVVGGLVAKHMDPPSKKYFDEKI